MRLTEILILFFLTMIIIGAIFSKLVKKLWWKLIEDIHINESDPQKILILENEFKMIHRKQKLERILK